MDDEEIVVLEDSQDLNLPDKSLRPVPPNTTIAEFCLDSIKRMMVKTPDAGEVSTFSVLHAGSVYYIDMMVCYIAPPYTARDPRLSERQWFGQRLS